MSKLIVTRFPPEPSGHPHAGHLKAIYANLQTAQKSKGYTILRFDDTNPSTSKQEYVDSILTSLDDYGLLEKFKNGNNPSYASNYFDVMMNVMKKLIIQGDAYLDKSTPDEISTQRHEMKPSPYRDMSPDENLMMWNDFVAGKLPSVVGRFKISFNSPNASLRDPIVYRYNNSLHFRTGDKYKIYPTYDLACPVTDSLDGVTLAMRTSEFNEKNDLCKWFFKKLPDMRPVSYKSYSRLVFEYSILSKRKIKELIDNNIIESWDDPRLDTLSAELRKGIVPQTWHNYFTKHGISSSNSVEEWDKIYNINRKIIDTSSVRIMAITNNHWNLMIDDLPVVENNVTKIVQWSPKDKHDNLGVKEIKLSSDLVIDDADAKLLKIGDLVYLLNFRAIKITSIDPVTRKISSICYESNESGIINFKEMNWIISWLTNEEYCNLNLNAITTYYGYIITKQSITKDDNVDDYLNKDSKRHINLHISHNKNHLKKGQIIQLIRFGFYIVDSVEPLNLIFIREPGNRLQYLLSTIMPSL